MITRPLDLASKMRPEPRSFDWLFLVNGGLIVLFFMLFGSRFVLAPGLGVGFNLPEVAGANANAQMVTHVISVMGSGQIITSEGPQPQESLFEWLKKKASTEKSPSLLVQADVATSVKLIVDITSMAQAAGFRVHLAARESAPKGGKR